MNRRAVLLTALAFTIVAVFWTRAAAPPAPAAPARAPARARMPAARSPDPALAPAPAHVRPARNVFEYADARGTPAAPTLLTQGATAPVAAPAPPTPAPAVRLVALVQRAGRLLAALSIHGEVQLLAPGEAAAGYTVVAIDEDSGVRLAGPDGTEELLHP